jgi:hypothetical protein
MAKKNNSETTMSAKMEQAMAALYVPFPADKIKKRKGRSGQMWDYVESSEVINRLNEVFGCAWSLTEMESILVNNYVLKRVRLEIADPDGSGRTFMREGWGGHQISGDPSDAMKSAYSKASVKAASLFGVGLHLWGVSSESIQEETDLPWDGPSQFTSAPQQQGQPVMAPIQQQQQVVQAPPQLSNPNAGMMPVQQQPPVQQQLPVGPVPNMTNPNVGYTTGPGTPAQAQVQFQSVPQQAPQQVPQQQPMMQQPQQQYPAQQTMEPQIMQNQGTGIVAHQLSAIRGAATMNGFNDPMILVRQVLGNININTVEELTEEQAASVLAYVRQTQGV